MAEIESARTRRRKGHRKGADRPLRQAHEGHTGYAFPPDNEWQHDFEAHFEYNETDDQLRCINEIKNDMEREAPMDRLLCGDVGFGKTEVALRAAFKCVTDGKQCAMLVPTTILAWQHYQTVLKRMEGFPVDVELLSRFRTPQAAGRNYPASCRRGEIDMIVGTHRLVSERRAVPRPGAGHHRRGAAVRRGAEGTAERRV